MQHNFLERQVLDRLRVLPNQGQSQPALGKIFVKRRLRNALRQFGQHPAVLRRKKKANADIAADCQQQTQPPERPLKKQQQEDEGSGDAGDYLFNIYAIHYF